MRRLLGLIGLLSVAMAAPAAMAQPFSGGMYGIKIAVKDYQKTIDFYTLLGMKMGPKHNPAEWELQWNGPSQGSNIIMVHDESGRSKLAPGGAFMMISVPDVKATAGKLKSAGFPDIGEPRVTPRATILMIKDPDGNQIELLGPGGK